MAFKKLTIIATPQVIMIAFKGKRIQFTNEKKEFMQIKELVRAGDEEALIAMIDKGGMIIPEYSNGLFKVDEANDRIIDIATNTEVNDVLGHRILQWAKDGFPFEPLLSFHRKVLKNPSKESAAELYKFLEANMIPITNEGNFIAYKKVTTVNGQLMDSHSKTINNNVGNIVSVPRQSVDPNRNNTCSNGLHVGAWEYVSSFTGDVVLEVEVEPQDVVTVPPDYNEQKMRVCRYKVLGRSNGSEIKETMVKVHKKNTNQVSKKKKGHENTEGRINARIEKVDFNAMTAREIKEYILTHYGEEITLDNKNKQAIVKKAYKIISE